MQLQSRLLSESEVAAIHRESLRILEQAGVRFYSRKALGLLAKAGACVDDDTGIATIPAELCEQALNSSPKSFTLGARNPRYDYPLPSEVSRYALDGTAAFAQDFHSGERRYGRDMDNELALRVFQHMDLGVMAWPAVAAEDKPAGSRSLYEWFSMLKFCSKHGQHELHHPAQAAFLAEGLTAVLGSADEVRTRHAYSLIYCPVAPLVHDGPMMDAYIELGSLDLPIMILPMPVTGTTGPASLFGNICLSNAEALSSIVVYQLAHPGRPLIYSSATGSMDMRSGAFLGGTPEMGLMSAALVEIGRSYDLPATSAGCTADARQPGPDAVLEKLVTSLPPVLSGSDVLVGYGCVESDQLLVLEQIVVDNEIGHMCERIFQGVNSSPDRVLTDDIIKVGPAGNFLAQRSTRELARSGETFLSSLMDRHTRDQWLELGRPDLYTNARKKVEEILAAPVDDPLAEEVSQALDEILERADRELKS